MLGDKVVVFGEVVDPSREASIHVCEVSAY